MGRGGRTRRGVLTGRLRRAGAAVLAFVLLFSATAALAAEVTIDDSTKDATVQIAAGANVVFTSDQTGYVFYVDSTHDVVYRKTTDGGISWGSVVTIDDATPNVTWGAVGIWYDKWTPGGTGSTIHIAASEITTDDTWYHNLDTSTDTIRSGGWVAAILGTTWSATQGGPSIVKSTDQHLFIAGANSTSPTYHVSKSTNVGGSWSTTSIGTTTDGTQLDRCQLLPLSGGDVIVIRQVASATDIRSNVFDEATDAWSGWSNVDTDWLASYSQDLQPWSASLYLTTGDIYFAGNNDPGASTTDIRVQKFDDGDRTWSALTDVESNNAAMAGANMMIDQTTGDLYVAYGKGAVYGSDIDVYWKKSTDGGTSWGSATKINATTDDMRMIYGNMMSDERLYATWYNDDLDDLLGNTVVDLVSTSAVTGTVYTDAGTAVVGAGKTVAVSLNGGASAGTDETDAGGQYTVAGLVMTGGTIVAVYLDGETEDAVTVTLGSGSSMTGIHLYQDRLIVRSDSGAVALTNSHLDIADNGGDADIAAIYSVDGGALNVKAGRHLLVWGGDTFAPGANVNVGSGVTIRGAFEPGSATVTLSGAWLKEGTANFVKGTSTVILDGASQSVSGATLFHNLTKQVAATATLTLAATAQQSVSGALVLQGTEGGQLRIRSSTPGVAARFLLDGDSGSQTIDHLDVKDSDASGGAELVCLAATEGCTDSGNTTNWTFLTLAAPVLHYFFFFGF